MEQTKRHVKIGRNSGMTGAISVGSSSVDRVSLANSASTDPWVFDIQWSVYPQLEGKFKLFFTVNPELPLVTENLSIKPTKIVVQVAPSYYGGLVDNGAGADIWKWNSNVNFDINLSLSSTKLSDGKPSVWTFEANSNEEYCVVITYSHPSIDNAWVQWDFF